MLLTIILFALFIGLLIISTVLWATFLRLGLKWRKISGVTLRRVATATVMVAIAQFAVNASSLMLSSRLTETQTLYLSILQLAIAVIVACLIIARSFEIRFLRAFLVWLPTIFASAITLAFLHYVFTPYVYEAFYIPTNAMAPTLLGNHWKDACPECGTSRYCSPVDERFRALHQHNMICDRFHVSSLSLTSLEVYSPDRILVAKFLSPKRWDLIVFQFPENLSINYVKRLVGLPGEEIVIQDGAVWADGIRLSPPEALENIEYLSEIPSWKQSKLWGSPDKPALLGEDEYFVLGDFSAASNDSRLWQKGTPGHNAFAVPKSNLIGVATHIFWPVQRCCILR